MLSKQEVIAAQKRAGQMIKESGINIGEGEIKKIEVADFGLSDLNKEGAQIFTFISTERIGAKVLVLFSNQTLPEHWHPPINNNPGKEEAVRIIKGKVRVYIPGENNLKEGFIPKGKNNCYTSRHEIVLNERDQMVLNPGTKHWFQAGKNGAVFYSFSTTVRDVEDKFSDSDIERITKIVT